MSRINAPTGLSRGGKALWKAVTEDHELDATQLVQLEEACRAKDRCDRLDKILTGDTDTWVTVMHNVRTEDYEIKIDAALAQANATANLMKQLIAALRLPDEHGKKPQFRGPRGSQSPRTPSSGVSARDRLRSAG